MSVSLFMEELNCIDEAIPSHFICIDTKSFLFFFTSSHPEDFQFEFSCSKCVKSKMAGNTFGRSRRHSSHVTTRLERENKIKNYKFTISGLVTRH